MTAFISAGHDLKNSGAQANGFSEEKEMIAFRNKVLKKYQILYPDSKVITDEDSEPLRDYLKRIKTGEGSVVVEFHLDAFNNPKVSGISCWIGDDANENSRKFAEELCKVGSEVLDVPNRGVFKESQSFHKKLGLMRENGTVCLIELVPITNKLDMYKLHNYSDSLAIEFAKIIKKYEDIKK